MIMAVIWKRVNDTGKNWRHVYKVCDDFILFLLSRSYKNVSGKFSDWLSPECGILCVTNPSVLYEDLNMLIIAFVALLYVV